MRRVLGVGAVVLLVWAALEIHTYGYGGAFGGALDHLFEADVFDTAAERSAREGEESGTSGRAADAYQRALNRSTSRVDEAVDSD
jgi:hypothetical protein